MTQKSLLPARQRSSPEIALLNQRLSKYGDTVGVASTSATTPFRIAGSVTVVLTGIAFAMSLINIGIMTVQTIAGAFGVTGIVWLVLLYATGACVTFKRKVWTAEKRLWDQRGEFIACLFLGPLIWLSFVATLALLSKPFDWMDDQVEFHFARSRWAKDPKQALLNAFETHQQQYCMLWFKDSDENELRSRMESWKSWWQSIEQGAQAGVDMTELTELASQMREELQSTIIYKANRLEPNAQKSFDAAQFQVAQIQQARLILTEPDDLEKLVTAMQLAEAKLSEAADALKLIADAQSLAMYLPELQHIIQVAENKKHLDRCEQAQNQLAVLIRQAEQVESDRLS